MTFYEFSSEPEVDDPDFDAADWCDEIIEADDLDTAIGQSGTYKIAEENLNSAAEGWMYDGDKVTHFRVTAHYRVECTILRTS